MLRTMDRQMRWVDGRERRLSGAAAEAAALVLGVVVLLALVL
jgi:hypothetical protein